MPGTARFPARKSTSTTSWKKGRPIRLHPAPPPVAVRARCDDRGMTVTPVSLSQALATFSDVYSPRIIGRVNDYDIRIAHVRGEHVWHAHDHTDEFFLVLDGRFDIALRDGGRERTITLRSGDIFVVPKGTEHKPSSPGGSILMFEPSGTLTTGDRHEGDVPGHVDSTTGRDISGLSRMAGTPTG